MHIFKDINEVALEKIIEEIENERKFIEDVRLGKIKKDKKELIKTALFIVESPNKVKTISSFFGKPSIINVNGLKVYEVSVGNLQLLITHSKGHIIDLTTENIGFYGIEKNGNIFIPYYNTIKKCLDCGNQFTEYSEGNKCPYCGSVNVEDSINRIKALQDLATEVDMIIIATDPDQEGEFIAASLYFVLKPFNDNIKRAEFHEVTKYAILEALNNLREINKNLVKSQLVRRIEDRWLGFSLSQILQKYYNKQWLSAGRVQTPVLGWIVERFEERLKSKSYVLYITLENERIIRAVTNLKTRREVNKVAKELVGKNIEIIEYLEYEDYINPLPPYNTSSILKDANSIFHLSSNKIMNILQELFESSLITYHRTDSTKVSSVGISIAREYIENKFGLEYYVGRTWGEGGAHEAIRPVRPLDAEQLKAAIEEGSVEVPIDMTNYHYRIYDLIFRRFIQSQMKPAKVKKYKQKIRVPIIDVLLEFEGVIEVLDHGIDLIDPFRINLMKYPKFEKNYEIKKVIGRKTYLITLFSEANVIELMKEKGIGRPSTYATILRKILSRGYVINKSNNLIPTKFGIEVYRFLKNNFDEHVSEEKTRKLEDIMDKISDGREDFISILNNLYEETIEIIKKGEEIIKR